MEKEKIQNIAEINLKNLFKILAKRKITFFIAFFIVFNWFNFHLFGFSGI